MSRHEYCTLFDSKYLPRGLTLYRSLERTDDDFLLRAVCMDEGSRELLARLELPRLRLIDIAEVERADPELRSTRGARTSWEYCWTASPAICRYVLEREPGIDVLTYLDADLCLWSAPAPLFEELGDGSVMLIPHRGSDELARTVGVYNVGWVSFRNDAHGREALWWWRERCIEWCFERSEPGRFADQMYLDDFTERFNGVRVCANPAAGVARWNDWRFDVTANADGEPLIDGIPLVFYHHAGLRMYRGDAPSARVGRRLPAMSFTASPQPLAWSVFGLRGGAVLELIWKPYLTRMSEAAAELRSVGAPATIGMRPTLFREAVVRLWMSRPLDLMRRAYRRMPLGVRTRARRIASAS